MDNTKGTTKTGEDTQKIPPLRDSRLAVLILTSKGKAKGGEQVFRLHKERIVLGSVVSADVRLTGDGIAPIHAIIEFTSQSKGDQAVIYDLASDTGLYVNGTKVITQAIKGGDEITVGVHKLKFFIEDIGDSKPKSPSRESEGRQLYMDANEDFKPLLLEDERDVEEIFDYRPAQKRALEVVMSWSGTILDVEHFTNEKSVTIGATRSDFAIPPLLGNNKYPIVTHSGDSYTLNLDPQMKGVMQRKGKLHTLEGVHSMASQGPAGYSLPLEDSDFAKISIGEIDFYLSFTAAPPRLKRGRVFEKDPFFMKIFLASMLMTAAMIGALLSIKVPQTLEAEQVPERIATILYQPEKYSAIKIEKTPVEKTEVKTPVKPPEPEKIKPKPPKVVKLDIKPNPVPPKVIPKEMDTGPKTAVTPPKKVVAVKPPAKAAGVSKSQNQAKEGEGARAKGEEGKRGSKNAKPVTGVQPQNMAKRPSPQGGAGRGAGDSQVKDQGNVDLLKDASGKIQNLLGNSAAQLGKGGEKLAGFGGFTTQGNGGLALSGDGAGGGGDAASLGGLGKKGRGGGRVGTGMGAAGDGSGIIGGQARVAIRSGGPEEAVVMGSIDANAVEAALLAHRDEFRLCYEKEINAENPSMAGRVGTNFVIGSSGRVTQAGIASSSLHNSNAERCIVAVIKRIDFPIPRGGGIVQVTYPFKFSSTGG